MMMEHGTWYEIYLRELWLISHTFVGVEDPFNPLTSGNEINAIGFLIPVNRGHPRNQWVNYSTNSPPPPSIKDIQKHT